MQWVRDVSYRSVMSCKQVWDWLSLCYAVKEIEWKEQLLTSENSLETLSHLGK